MSGKKKVSGSDGFTIADIGEQGEKKVKRKKERANLFRILSYIA